MKIVIATLNSKFIHSSLAPWCLLAGIRTYGDSSLEPLVIEGTINQLVEDTADKIIEQKPDILGLSCYIWNIKQTHALIQMVKTALPNVVIAVGGPEVGYCAKTVLSEHPLIDFVLSGEGEKPFAELCNALLHGKNQYPIGVSYRTENGIYEAEPYISGKMPPSPYTEEYLNALNGRIAYLETSRGCPYSCAFCLSGRCGKVCFFDLERAKNEMVLLANSGTQTVKLVDRTFNANRERAEQLFSFIIEQYGVSIPKGVCFHFEIAGDILTDSTLEILSRAPKGAIQLEIGMQSFHEPTLQYIHRKTNTKRLISNIQKLTSFDNMHIHIDLIAGLPFEDIRTFEKSFNIGFSLGTNMLQLGFLKLIHGSDMRENPERYPCSFDSEPPYEVTETPWLSREDILQLHGVEDALERIANSGRFPSTLAYLLNFFEPFELFLTAAPAGHERISLDEYTDALYRIFSSHPKINRACLRDEMVKDRIASNATGRLPASLRIEDKNLGKIKRALELRYPTPTGVKRGMAVLYTTGEVVYADYCHKDPITGRYETHITKI